MYKFVGVPHVFDTKAQALSFLRNSPGYVQRRSSYLQTYWPGLAAELGITHKVATPASTRGPQTVQRTVTKGKNVFDVIDEAAKPVVHAAAAAGKAVGKPVVTAAVNAAYAASPRPGGLHPAAIPKPVQAAAAGAASAVDTGIDLGVGPNARKAARRIADPTQKGLTNPLGGGNPLGLGAEIGMAMIPAGGGAAGKIGEKLAAKEAGDLLAKKAGEDVLGKVGEHAAPVEGLPGIAGAVAADTSKGLAEIRKAVANAPSVRKQQEVLRSEEKGRRLTAFEQRMQVDGIDAARAELRGKLPEAFAQDGPPELTEDVIRGLKSIIENHPGLKGYEPVRADDGLQRILAGRYPTRSQQKVLVKTFGRGLTEDLQALAGSSLKDRVKKIAGEVWNTPRALQASFDLSAPMRQGLVAGMRHPVIFKRNIVPMIKAAKSEDYANTVRRRILDSPNLPYYERMGIHIGDHEEQFAAHYLEKGKMNPVAASSRAYNTFLTSMRADMADHAIAYLRTSPKAARRGWDLEDEKLLRDMGRFINDATGRGSLGKLENSAQALSVGFFSPRLIASRLSLLTSPASYWTAHPMARREALRSTFQTLGTLMVVLGAAKAAGADVSLDPRSSDFGKIKVGNTRVDLAGGFQQYFHLAANLATEKNVSPTTGEVRQRGIPTSLGRFARSKMAPSPSVVTDFAFKKDFLGNPVSIHHPMTMAKEFEHHLLPLLWQDSTDLYNEHHGGMNGISAAILGYGVGMWGVGTQTFEGKEPLGSSSGSSVVTGSSFGSSPRPGSSSRSGSSGSSPRPGSSSSSSSSSPRP